MKQSQLIARNIVVVLSSEIIGFGLNFLVIILLARYLGTIGFGNYSFIIAFVGVFQLLADSGLSNIMIREVSVNKENLSYQMGVTKSLIWVLSVFVFLIILVVINILNTATEIKHATYIMGLALLAMVHAIGYGAIFKALEEIKFNAAGFILHKIVLLSLTILIIRYKLGLIEIAVAHLFSNMLLWFFYYTIISYRYVKPKMIFNIKTWWYFITEAAPVGASSILRKISWQVDILILSQLGSVASVGLFSAPYRIIQSLTLLPYTLAIPLFPHLSRLGRSSHKELFQTFEKTMKFMYLLSVPFFVILATLSYTIILLIFGEKYIDSYIALQLLSVTVLFLFPTTQFIYLFSALGNQRFYTICSVVGIIVNIGLDIILIPRLDFIGACIGTLVAEISLFAVGVYYTKLLRSDISYLRASWKPLAAGVLMWAVLFPFRNAHSAWVIVGLCASLVAYVFSVFSLKTFTNREIEIMKGSIWLTKGPGTEQL